MVFVNIGEKLTRDGMIELGKKLDRFMTTSVDCLKHDFTIAELAEKMGVDNIYLSCYITNELEMDFYTYVNDFRLDYASALLQSSSILTVDEVAAKAGFSSMAVFESLFMKRYNCTPELFREQGTYKPSEIVKPLFDLFAEKRPSFVSSLKAYEPSLTDIDLGCCILMAFGYSSVRAATFLGTSVESYEIALCRLRSKLGLLHTDSLEAFVEKI